jgi:hypothetical protein
MLIGSMDSRTDVQDLIPKNDHILIVQVSQGLQGCGLYCGITGTIKNWMIYEP